MKLNHKIIRTEPFHHSLRPASCLGRRRNTDSHSNPPPLFRNLLPLLRRGIADTNTKRHGHPGHMLCYVWMAAALGRRVPPPKHGLVQQNVESAEYWRRRDTGADGRGRAIGADACGARPDEADDDSRERAAVSSLCASPARRPGGRAGAAAGGATAAAAGGGRWRRVGCGGRGVHGNAAAREVHGSGDGS